MQFLKESTGTKLTLCEGKVAKGEMAELNERITEHLSAITLG